MYDNAGDLPPSKNPEERRIIIETASKQKRAGAVVPVPLAEQL